MKKVLIIAYYWPPAGGPGVQRWLKFIKYLKDFDVEPVLYIPENPHYPIQDETLIGETPLDLKIYRHPIFEPYKAASVFSSKKTKRISSGIIQTKKQSVLEKLFLWIRGNLFIPDARKFWVNPSVKHLTKIINQEQVDTIITTGPPHSVHLIGLRLKKQLHIKWIADFRDPWTTIGYHKKLKLTQWAAAKHKELEKNVLTNADTTIVTSPSTKTEFEGITNKPVVLITNGYDTEFGNDIVLDQKFTLSHIGSLLTGRNPHNLWQVLRELVDENEDFRNSFRLQLIGVVSKDVLETVYKYGLEKWTDVLGYQTHKNAIKQQQKSQALLLVEINSEETKGIIPGKLFEYMAANRPILGLGPKNWDVDAIISSTKSGVTFTYDQKAELKTVLLKWFEAFKLGELQNKPENLTAYSRRELTRKLVKNL